MNNERREKTVCIPGILKQKEFSLSSPNTPKKTLLSSLAMETSPRKSPLPTTLKTCRPPSLSSAAASLHYSSMQLAASPKKISAASSLMEKHLTL